YCNMERYRDPSGSCAGRGGFNNQSPSGGLQSWGVRARSGHHAHLVDPRSARTPPSDPAGLNRADQHRYSLLYLMSFITYQWGASMLRFPKITTQVMAVAAVSVLALSACGRGGGDDTPSPGITDDTVTLGVSNPLSGPVAGPGGCLTDGVIAYFEARNADGGIEFGDGKTRQVEVKALDDTYDPQKAKSNYDQLHKDSFILGLGLGTPTNRAWRDAAIEDGVPQVLTSTGDPLFSDRDESPLQIDAFPTYVSEGAAFGEMLVENDEEYKVAVLRQNDDYGMDYLTGL